MWPSRRTRTTPVLARRWFTVRFSGVEICAAEKRSSSSPVQLPSFAYQAVFLLSEEKFVLIATNRPRSTVGSPTTLLYLDTVEISTHFASLTHGSTLLTPWPETYRRCHLCFSLAWVVQGCTHRAMDGAAGNGHLEVIQWLHENRNEGCTGDAIFYAAKVSALRQPNRGLGICRSRALITGSAVWESGMLCFICYLFYLSCR